MPKTGAALQVTALLRELVLRVVQIGVLDDSRRVHDGLVQVLLDELVRAQTLPVSLTLPRDRRALAVVERLRKDPSCRLELTQIAEGSGASPRTLQRLFRDETGLRFTEWRRRLRLLHAMERLSDGASVNGRRYRSGL